MKFVDRTKLFISSGKGGDGCISWNKEKYKEFGGPNGGNGGNGGNVYIKGNKGQYSLYDLKLNPHQSAGDGKAGSGRNKTGKVGKDLIISVPLGTIAIDELSNLTVTEVLTTDKILILTGGKGGFGNNHFKSSTCRAPNIATQGENKKKQTLILELKIIADIGLVGLPNAGKSTFIRSISNAKPQIADYPFTTINPHLGVVKLPNFKTIVVADIPGIIKGASKGVGLGLRFLQHIQRTKLLVFVLDCSTLDSLNPISTYNLLLNELKSYNKQIITKPQFIILSKKDKLSSSCDLTPIFSFFKKKNISVCLISAKQNEGIESFLNNISKIFQTI